MSTEQKSEHWQEAFKRLMKLLEVIGPPVTLFNGPKLLRAIAKRFRALIVTLELYVRELLLTEALALPEAKSKPSKHKTPSTRFPGRSGFGGEDSADWQVHFPLTAPREAAPSKRAAKKPVLGGSHYVTPKALAERLEALVRVIADPAPYAARLARRLYRLKAAARSQNDAPRFALTRDGRLARVFRDMGVVECDDSS